MIASRTIQLILSHLMTGLPNDGLAVDHRAPRLGVSFAHQLRSYDTRLAVNSIRVQAHHTMSHTVIETDRASSCGSYYQPNVSHSYSESPADAA